MDSRGKRVSGLSPNETLGEGIVSELVQPMVLNKRHTNIWHYFSVEALFQGHTSLTNASLQVVARIFDFHLHQIIIVPPTEFRTF